MRILKASARRCAIIIQQFNTLMSKQDAVDSGLRVHLHRKGFIWGLWRCVKSDRSKTTALHIFWNVMALEVC